MQETGFVVFWTRQMKYKTNIKNTVSYIDESENHIIELDETRTIFIILLIGLPIATIGLIFEMLFDRHQLRLSTPLTTITYLDENETTNEVYQLLK